MYQVFLIFASVVTCSDHKRETRVPWWSGFYKLVLKPDLDRITAGYLTPLPFSPTKTKAIVEIRRTQDIMKEHEKDFILIEADEAI